MRTFSASIKIARPPEVIWSVLTDAARYSEWATGIHRFEGQIANGEVPFEVMSSYQFVMRVSLIIQSLVDGGISVTTIVSREGAGELGSQAI